MLIDLHADILYRMNKEKQDFYDENSLLHASYAHLQEGEVKFQVFATFIDPILRGEQQLLAVIDSLDRFHQKIKRKGIVEPVLTVSDVQRIRQTQGILGALLSLEGADCLAGHASVLSMLYALGVRLIGLTWNHGNSLADGILEPRGGGITGFGREVIEQMQQLGMVIDVSHASDRVVEDVVQIVSRPIIASHSNARAVYPAKRNLEDEHMKLIAATGGVIGVTFVPEFIADKNEVMIEDLLRHLLHMLRVVGADAIALGSDFDGITTTMADLRDSRDYPVLIERLHHEIGHETTKKIMGENIFRVLTNTLPK
nr:dipeptidase [Bacilli bacterium]